jgi:hypothetical protein
MRRTLGVAAAVTLAVPLAVAGVASAASAQPTFTYSPTSGPPGTVIRLSDPGGACAYDEQDEEFEAPFVVAGLAPDPDDESLGPDPLGGDVSESTPLDPDGVWSLELRIFDEGPVPGRYLIQVRCYAGPESEPRPDPSQPPESYVTFADESFLLTAGAEPGPGEEPTGSQQPPPPAPPATAVPRQPTYTG